MNQYWEKIRKAGLKLTPRRKAIVDIFIKRNRYASAEDVWGKLLKKFKRCGLPSVYRNLESLVDCGVLAKVEKFDNKKYYALCLAGTSHHHHIVCLSCDKVEDISCYAGESLKKIKGFKVLNHFFQASGICAACVKGGKV